MKGVDHARRQILAWGAAMAGVAIAPGITLFDLAHGRPPSEPASRTKRWGMLVDVNRCSADCNACVVACDRENGLPIAKTATSAQWIRKVELKDMRGATKSLPMMCQHCAEPPCVDVCPTGASFKRADGIVLVDRHTCIGCRYCMMACPYKARSFVHEPVRDQKPEVPRGKGAWSRARCACTASTATGFPLVSRPARRAATTRSCSATSTTPAARSRSGSRPSRPGRCAPT